MARVELPVTELTISTSTAKPTLTKWTGADGMWLDIDGDCSNLLIGFEYTSSGSSGVTLLTVTAGDNPPAFRAGLGDLTITSAGSSATLLSKFLTLESARFVQATSGGSGIVLIDSVTECAGSAFALRLPQGI